MGNVLLANPALSDAATLLAVGNEVATLPATNLFKRLPGLVTRTSGLSNIYWELDLGSAQAIDLVFLAAPNASASAQWQIRGATSQANLTAAPGYNSALIDMTPAKNVPASWKTRPAVLFFGPETYRYWRVDVSDGSNPDGQGDYGRLYLSKAWQASLNMEYGFNMGWIDPSKVARAIDGTPYIDTRPRRREFNLEFTDLPRTEILANPFTTDRTLGIAGDHLLVLDPDLMATMPEYVVYGRMAELGQLTNVNLDIWSRRVRFEEIV